MSWYVIFGKEIDVVRSLSNMPVNLNPTTFCMCLFEVYNGVNIVNYVLLYLFIFNGVVVNYYTYYKLSLFAGDFPRDGSQMNILKGQLCLQFKTTN